MTISQPVNPDPKKYVRAENGGFALRPKQCPGCSHLFTPENPDVAMCPICATGHAPIKKVIKQDSPAVLVQHKEKLSVLPVQQKQTYPETHVQHKQNLPEMPVQQIPQEASGRCCKSEMVKNYRDKINTTTNLDKKLQLIEDLRNVIGRDESSWALAAASIYKNISPNDVLLLIGYLGRHLLQDTESKTIEIDVKKIMLKNKFSSATQSLMDHLIHK